MKKLISFLFILFAVSVFANGQTDAEGCEDHPLLTRLENFYIASCEQNFNELQLRMLGNKTETKEGNLFVIYYRYNSDAGVKPKSAMQVIKNYEIAITRNGGKMIYKNSNPLDADIEATYYLSAKDKEYWIKLTSFAGTANEVEAYALNILEIESMNQEVVASEMFEAISRDGFIALYINFDTGKATVKPESIQIIDQIESMMIQNPGLKISIEGHTDNSGNSASNQSLSEQRAKSVMNLLVARGISASRLKSMGWGQTKPVADNTTEEGKSKNRRVEIIKF
jgi:outer membrane protein OmpA-like peptidoglycan-associated protein